MSAVFGKLNLKDQKKIVILNAPASFETEIAALKGCIGTAEDRGLSPN